MTWRPERILVTGAAGFLGRHLCRCLVADGLGGRIVALDDFSAGDGHALAGLAADLDVVSGDIREPSGWRARVGDVDLVFHLAALSSPRGCEESATLARSINVHGTARLLEAVGRARVVLLSTATVYRPRGDEPLDETASASATAVYPATKLAAERLCAEAAEAGTIDAVIVRNFNSYGPGQTGHFLVPQLVRQALEQSSIRILACRSVRDFAYVGDTVDAIAALALSRQSGIFNLGSGHATAVGDVALAVGDILGASVSCTHLPPSGARCLVASPAKLMRAVGWQPGVDLRQGLVRTAEWYRAALLRSRDRHPATAYA